MKRKFRFFSESTTDYEVLEIEGKDSWEIADKLDEAFEQEGRSKRWDGVEDYHGPLEG